MNVSRNGYTVIIENREAFRSGLRFAMTVSRPKGVIPTKHDELIEWQVRSEIYQQLKRELEYED